MKILILCLIVVTINAQSSEIYTCIRNVSIAVSLQQTSLIASFEAYGEVLCLGACNRNPNCLSCSWNNDATSVSDDCYLYNRVFTSNDYSYASNVNLYLKKRAIQSQNPIQSGCNSSLMCYFTNTILTSNITNYNGQTFGSLLSTEMVIVNNTPVYFLADYWNSALIKMSSTWQYIAKGNYTIAGPRVIKWANDHLYVSSDNGFHKMDYNFNITQSIVDNFAVYNGIYHNASDNTFAVTLWYRNRVDWIDPNLTVLANVSLEYYEPVGVSGYGDLLYVSANVDGTSTLIYVIRNRQIMETLTVSNTTALYIYSIVFDDYGYMALSFASQGTFYLYHMNGTSTGFHLTFPSPVYHINFDFNKRMMISSRSALYFFN